MLKGKELSGMIQTFKQRLEGLDAFLHQLAFDSYGVCPLYDEFGPAIIDPDIEAIVITPESMDTAQESTIHSTFMLVNYERKQMGYDALDIIEVCYVCVDTKTETIKLSSSLLRRLEHDEMNDGAQ